MVSSLEMELSKTKVQAHILEQENHILKQELEKTKQVQHPAWYHPSDGVRATILLAVSSCDLLS